VNAVTLMEIREPGGAEQQAFAPVVRYASRQGIGDGARLMGPRDAARAGVIARDRDEAITGATAALVAAVREP
jgi:hypothetical protein